jgi:eukaryotic-like serine/threonine-protein kinase
VGQGGMGSVWRATHTGLGEEIAIKLVSAHFARSREALRRFDTEAKSAAKLRSRHVPQVFDNGVLEDGTPYLVMELLRGEALAARIARLGPIALPEAVSIVEQCSRALARAHSLGIVHRDIKPENIYLAQSVDDEGYIVKVLDFGIAKVASTSSEDGRSSTRTGTVLGTPLYMSPEQARGLRSIDSRTDLYSLGLVCYTMLTGRLPFLGETLGELLLQICAEPLPSLGAAAPGLPPTMEGWFQKACARQPEDRYPSAQALVEALRVAAGISSAGQSDVFRGPALASGESGPRADSALPSPGPKGFATAATPATTGGASVPMPAPGPRRGRWIVVGASAAVGLAVIPIVAIVVRGQSPPVAATAVTARPPAPIAQSALDAASREPIAPVATQPTPPAAPVAPGPTAHAAAPQTLPPGHPLARPVPAPPPAAAKPAVTAKPTAKPAGGIDLGY